MILPQNISFITFITLVATIFLINHAVLCIIGGYQKYYSYSPANNHNNHLNFSVFTCIKNKALHFKTMEAAFSLTVFELIILFFISLISTY